MGKDGGGEMIAQTTFVFTAIKEEEEGEGLGLSLLLPVVALPLSPQDGKGTKGSEIGD